MPSDAVSGVYIALLKRTDNSDTSYITFVVRDDSINAFALPGGFIGVNYGLILTTNNEAQLASVLAHETAHVTQRHIARGVKAQGRQSIASAAAILAAILLGATTGASADAVQGAIAISQGAALQSQINFTRANEYEADRVGMGFLAAAGFDPNSMADLFDSMGRRAGLAGRGIPELMAEKIMGPLGMEQDAYYVTDGAGVAFVLGGLNVATRDYARFALMVEQGGMYGGRQVVPADWIAASTVPSAPCRRRSPTSAWAAIRTFRKASASPPRWC